MTPCNQRRSIGLTPTLHVLGGESFHTEISTLANGIIYAVQYITRMVIVKLFPTALSSFGFHSVVYFYAMAAASFTIWGLITIKDTDKLSLSQIQSMYDTGNEEEIPLIEQKPNQG